jgi:hypothetical protein
VARLHDHRGDVGASGKDGRTRQHGGNDIGSGDAVQQ